MYKVKEKTHTRPSLWESFSWVPPDWRVANFGRKSIKVKGHAICEGVTSRNNRKYVGDELLRSARTLEGVPVTINHAPYKETDPNYDSSKVVGNVTDAEYQDGCIEFTAVIKKRPYVELIRNKSAEIQGVSVEADYLSNHCIECGKKFYAEDEFRDHMFKEHFIKVPVKEVHGIHFRALSLVLSPEQPGIPNADLAIWETAPKKPDALQLLEKWVIPYQKEVEKHMAKQKKKTEKKVPYKTKQHEESLAIQKLREQQDHGCKEDEHWSEEEQKCVPHRVEEQEGHDCGEDEHWDEEQQKCVANVTEQVEAPVQDESNPNVEGDTEPLACADGFHLENDECVADQKDVVPQAPPMGEQVEAEPSPPIPEQPAQEECGVGEHKDPETGLCVADATSVGDATGTAVEFKVALPKMLRLGEPFAGYDDHADCVAKNQDKDDPDAYCADVKRKVEGGASESISENVYDSQKQLRTMIKNQRVSTRKRNRKITESMNKLNSAVAKIVVALPKFAESCKSAGAVRERRLLANVKALVKEVKSLSAKDKTLTEQTATNMKKTTEQLTKTIKELQEDINKKLGSLATTQAKETQRSKKDASSIKKTLANINSQSVKEAKSLRNALTDIGKESKSIKEQVDSNKRDYEKILAAADKVSTDKIKTLEQTIKEQDDELEKHKCGENEHYDKEQGKCVPNKPAEPSATEKKLKEMAVDVENLKAKLKGQFRGQSKKLEGKDEEDLAPTNVYDSTK